MINSPHRAPRPGEAAIVVSLLWVYIGCRATVRVLDVVTLPVAPRARRSHT